MTHTVASVLFFIAYTLSCLQTLANDQQPSQNATSAQVISSETGLSKSNLPTTDASRKDGRTSTIKQPEKKLFKFAHDGSTLDISFYFFPEFFYGRNLTLLNNRNPDELILFRHFIDSFLTYSYGDTKREIFKAKCSVRSRSVWGSTSVIETTDAPIKEVNAVFGVHRHAMLLNEIWVRELWFEVSLNDILCLPFCARHVLICGAFFFEIGRGISLGAIYPSMPAILGFFIDAQIDQYAFGAKLNGELVKDCLSYDIYGSILNNKSALFDQTNQIVRAPEYGHRHDGARGFGSINYVVAGRLQWYPIKEADKRKVYLEPYVVYNHNPEIRLDLIHDGISDLATFGLMGEYAFGPIEAGFEYGFNRGRLHAFGIDRNKITLLDEGGTAVVVNDQVIDLATGSLAAVTDKHQAIINTSAETQQQNNKLISTFPPLKNRRFRFRDPYTINYRGFFLVADASYIWCKDMFKISAAIGLASGGEDPRKALALGKATCNTVDYEGFITLNESYAGKRVSSTLFFNGFGTFPRIIDIGLEGLLPDATVLNLTGFTNLIYLGASCDYNYKNSFHIWRINPNLLFYWTEEPASKFNSQKHPRIAESYLHRRRLIDNFLGTEINIICENELLKDFTLFIMGAIFIPGFHFREIKGMPLNDAHRTYIEQGHCPRESLLGNDPAYFINIGCKYTF